MMIMKNIVIREVSENNFLVIADTKRFGRQEVLFQGIKREECINYINENGTPYKEHENEKRYKTYEVIKATPEKGLKVGDKVVSVDDQFTCSRYLVKKITLADNSNNLNIKEEYRNKASYWFGSSEWVDIDTLEYLGIE
jgi:hypothetical protein